MLEMIRGCFFLISEWNICCDPSLEPPRWGSSNDGSQRVLEGCCGRLSLGYPSHPFFS